MSHYCFICCATSLKPGDRVAVLRYTSPGRNEYVCDAIVTRVLKGSVKAAVEGVGELTYKFPGIQKGYRNVGLPVYHNTRLFRYAQSGK